jgi:nickel-type superoxide dismutase maturation protease
MLPSLAPGDRLLVVKLRSPRPGDIVALRDPEEPGRMLVKRVVTVGPSGVNVCGDNSMASRDSRVFGPVRPEAVLGQAVYRYFPAAEAASLRHLDASGSTLGRDGHAPGGHRPSTGS